MPEAKGDFAETGFLERLGKAGTLISKTSGVAKKHSELFYELLFRPLLPEILSKINDKSPDMLENGRRED